LYEGGKKGKKKERKKRKRKGRSAPVSAEGRGGKKKENAWVRKGPFAGRGKSRSEKNGKKKGRL